MASFQIRRTFDGRQNTIVEIRGDLVGANTEALRRWLQSEPASRRVHLDLSRVGLVDAAARAVLRGQ